MIASLTDRMLVEAWSDSRDRPPDMRVDALLTCALEAGGDAGDHDRWPLARRHAVLAAMHASRWGSQVEAVATCPACGCEISVEFDFTALPQPVEPADDAGFRLPTRADVRAAADSADPPRALVARCLTDLSGELSVATIDAVAAAMEAADPLGALDLELTCPACGRHWQEPLDLDEFLAIEAQHEARSIAAEVHELAIAYGWSEADILALPPPRRRLYLGLVSG